MVGYVAPLGEALKHLLLRLRLLLLLRLQLLVGRGGVCSKETESWAVEAFGVAVGLDRLALCLREVFELEDG